MDKNLIELIKKNSNNLKSFGFDFEYLNQELCDALPNTIEKLILNQVLNDSIYTNSMVKF